MATSPVKLQQGYGIGNALQNLSPFSIIANRVPTQSDKARIGTFWIYTGANNVYVLSSVTGGLSNWLTLSNGGAGVFTSLTVNGASVFNGNITQIAGVTSLLATTTTGLTNNGVFNQTGNTVMIGDLTLTGTTILSGSITQNNGATLLNTDAIPNTINIGTGLADKVITIGNTTGATGLALAAGTNGISITGVTSFVTDGVPFINSLKPAAVASPLFTVNGINAPIQTCFFTGFTTAAAATETFVFNNTFTPNPATNIQAPVISVHRAGGTNGLLSIVGSVLAYGAGTASLTVTIINNDVAALNGNIYFAIIWLN